MDDICQCTTMDHLENSIIWSEITDAVKKLANGNSPGLNGVLPDAFKALDPTDLGALHDFLLAYWDG